MAAVQTEILEDVIAWAVVLAAPGGLSAGQVIKADANGPRPALPYMTARVMAETRIGHPEQRTYIDGGTVKRYWQEPRRATVSLQAFGPTAHQWLDRIRLHSETDAAIALTVAAGVSIRVPGSLTNVSALRGTGIEQHWSMDVIAEYEVNTLADAETKVPIGTVVVTTTAQTAPIAETDPDALTETTTIATGA